MNIEDLKIGAIIKYEKLKYTIIYVSERNIGVIRYFPNNLPAHLSTKIFSKNLCNKFELVSL